MQDASPPVRRPRRARASRRVLVVDDHTDARVGLALWLERRGFSTESAADGPGALTAVEKTRPDVVLLDLDLPGMDGFEVARRLRARPDFEKVRLVATSGFGDSETLGKVSRAGFECHLVKPIDLGRLLDLLLALP